MPKLAVQANERERKLANVNFRITGSVRDGLVAMASRNGRSLSAEVTAILEAALLGDTLMAALPRFIAEGIAADREAQRRDVLGRVTPFEVGAQKGFVGSNPPVQDWSGLQGTSSSLADHGVNSLADYLRQAALSR